MERVPQFNSIENNHEQNTYIQQKVIQKLHMNTINLGLDQIT